MTDPQRAPSELNHEPDAVEWARRKAGLTQAELARRIGVVKSLISEIEGGTRSATPEVLKKIADALNCPVVALERKRTYAGSS